MFIPIGDDNSKRTITPIVVWGVFAVNAFVWYLQLSLGDSFTYAFSAIPFEITRGVDLEGTRAIDIAGRTHEIRYYPGPSPIQLTLISAMFMHGSWMHIIGNMMYLLIFADQIEDLLGHVRFLLFYLVCGVAASIAHIIAAPSSAIPSLGASGAIAGVLGAYLIMYPQNQVRVLVVRYVVNIPASVVLGGWIAMQFFAQVNVGATGSGVAYMAHIGGFIAGAVLIFMFRRRQARSRR